MINMIKRKLWLCELFLLVRIEWVFCYVSIWCGWVFFLRCYYKYVLCIVCGYWFGRGNFYIKVMCNLNWLIVVLMLYGYLWFDILFIVMLIILFWCCFCCLLLLLLLCDFIKFIFLIVNLFFLRGVLWRGRII